MAAVSHRIAGLAALRRRLGSLPETARVAGATGLAEVARQAADGARAALAGARGPSLPGAPPADPASRLAASIAASQDPETGQAAVTVAAPEARFLEYGTARMAPRPFLRPAAHDAGQTARAILRAALGRAFGR